MKPEFFANRFVAPNEFEPGASPFEAFTGSIQRNKTGLLYVVGLAVAAFVMVLLPLIYFGVISSVAWAAILCLLRNSWMLDRSSGHGGFAEVFCFLTLVLAGGTILFFMIGPLLPRRPKIPKPITLTREQQPLLFEFVRRICELVGSRFPCSIAVDCQANASAALGGVLLRRELVLTLGLPLVSMLTMQEFAGLLGHEFGHFSQGFGLCFTRVIRRINVWFARVAYEQAECELRLAGWASRIDDRFCLLLCMLHSLASFFRRVPWLLVQVGHAVNCFMLRQMEYDADKYEAKVAGSDTFENTTKTTRLLSGAMPSAYAEVWQNWAAKRLPDNLPALISRQAERLSPQIRQELASKFAKEKTRWFYTHPCDSDRTRRVHSLNAPGVFRLDEPASRLFCDFEGLCKGVTREVYKHWNLQFTNANLVSGEESLRESEENRQASEQIKEYYGNVSTSLKPLLRSVDLEPMLHPETLLERWRQARAQTDWLRYDAQELSRECFEQQRRLADLTTARALCEAGFDSLPTVFNLPPNIKYSGEILDHAEQTSSAITDLMVRLEPFFNALRGRIISALALAEMTREEPVQQAAREVHELSMALVAVGAEMPNLYALDARLRAFMVLARARGPHPKMPRVDKCAAQVAGELHVLTAGIQERLRHVTYPFPHACGPLSVADYARLEQPPKNESDLTLEAQTYLERLFVLHHRLLGRVLSIVHTIETKLG